MALEAGTRFGAYEIAEPIGAGGMGEVYRATDTTLERDVAIKVLPESFAADAERIARFEREAKTLASLNHPNIAQIFGLEKSGGQTAIVMELVEGPTLAERIKEGPIPPDEALGIAHQVANALEAAHGAGVVHRDLKPANVKIKEDGTIKVLDFGIAKALDAVAISGSAPAMTTPAVTQTGVILGTAAYMSPEQARGKFVDDRTDVWAFGCLLFEMLTGQPAFGGDDVMLTLARVLDRETDMGSLPGTLSPTVRHTIALCLEKDPRKRIADIRDVRLALEGTFETGSPQVAEETQAKPLWKKLVPLAATAVIAVAITFVALGGLDEPQAPLVHRSVHRVPEDAGFNILGVPSVAISPDGSEFVYAANAALFRRPLDEIDGYVIRGTEDSVPTIPEYAPDGRSILYGSAAERQIKRVSIEGGTPQLVVDGTLSSWQWIADDVIYFSDDCRIGRMSADNLEPETLFEDEAYACYMPSPLPGNERLIFEQRPVSDETQAEIAVYSLITDERTVLFPGKQPVYLEPGYLAYFDPTLGLSARAFDPDTLAFGSAFAFPDEVLMLSSTSAAQFRVSQSGTLIYIRGASSEGEAGGLLLGIADEAGQIDALDLGRANYEHPSVSPDGSQIAVVIEAEGARHVYVYDLSGTSEIRQLTFEGDNTDPVWSPDGEWITYSSLQDGTRAIWQQRANGRGVAEQLTTPAEGDEHRLPVWAPTGELTYTETLEESNTDDIWIVAIPDGEPELLVGGEGDQLALSFAPGGSAMAYMSAVDGQAQIYAEPFPPDGSRVLVSEPGAPTLWPVWSSSGDRLSFQIPNRGMGAVGIDPETLSIRADRRDIPIRGPQGVRRAASMPDSDELLVVSGVSGTTASSTSPDIVVVENWIEEVKARVPPL